MTTAPTKRQAVCAIRISLEAGHAMRQDGFEVGRVSPGLFALATPYEVVSGSAEAVARVAVERVWPDWMAAVMVGFRARYGHQDEVFAAGYERGAFGGGLA